MESLRTPDDRFSGLADWPYEPNYVEVPDGEGGSLRVHYVDEGPADGEPVLLMHGEPTWGYLYRKMIPGIAAAGHRVIVPDLVGFGRSDKPAAQSDYTYERHVSWMHSALLDALDLNGITFFGQDWGGLIGLRLVAGAPERFARVVIGNTGLPTGEYTPAQAFLDWQKFSQETPDFPVGKMVRSWTPTPLSDADVAAYDAPFPDDTFKQGARIFPTLVPVRPDDPATEANKAAWQVFAEWEKPLVTCFSDGDPVTAGGFKPFHKLVPGAQHDHHVTVEGAGHFLQEDKPDQLVQIILDTVARDRA